ncbi:FtsQ-type POTRA domain-containing protein [Streptomyces sp. NBC_01808]|uniref:cell division protein FtsQ/DivIB n=1 Tax=Streptomyces sp. NBC_01808 TaxID=2975947 RepID=UPI002DDB0FB2|nr:FtsQ-type POTRA domain-containing protein [Streptomyces sp. NBC_01808]WSA37288.1 FtsQ-type POTRA domain-containing protein [Streptomyces sp. NBC_01808]
MAGAVREKAAAGREERGGGAGPGGPPAARRPAGRRGRRLRLPSRRVLIAVLVAVIVLGGFAGWALYGSNWLRVERVTVSGTDVLSADEVLDAARISEDVPMATVDTNAVEARLAAELPRIGSVDVDRIWPHRIAVKVTERHPAVLLRKGKSFVEVDDEGVRFATVRTAPENVPIVEMQVADSPSLDRFGRQRLRESAVRVAGALSESVRRDTRTILVRSYDSVTLELSGGRTVLWGSAERGAAKSKALAAVMKAERDARYFDVSVPSAPAASAS